MVSIELHIFVHICTYVYSQYITLCRSIASLELIKSDKWCIGQSNNIRWCADEEEGYDDDKGRSPKNDW